MPAGHGAGLSIIGDLRQEFAEQRRTAGAIAAGWWYPRQAASLWWWSAWRHPAVSHHYPRGGVLFDVIGDLRHALRAVGKTPGQMLLMVVTLGVGIGFTTIGFSFADTVFLRGMPIADPDRTVIVYGLDARDPADRSPVFASDYLDFRERAQSIEHLSAFSQHRATLLRTGIEPARVTVGRVTGDLFGVWGLRPQRGRGLRAGDDRPGAPRVAVLSDHFWRQSFDGSADALGSTILLDGVPHEIVGVMSDDVEFGNFANLAAWVPFERQSRPERDLTPLLVTGRLAEGRTVAAAAAELDILAQQIAVAHSDTNRGRRSLVLGSSRALGGPNVIVVMTLLVGTAALVTVIAGVNVAGVLLARTVARRREFALRVALGARNGRVFRQLLAEGLLVAASGAAAGLAVAETGLRLIRSVDAEPILSTDRRRLARGGVHRLAGAPLTPSFLTGAGSGDGARRPGHSAQCVQSANRRVQPARPRSPRRGAARARHRAGGRRRPRGAHGGRHDGGPQRV